MKLKRYRVEFGPLPHLRGWPEYRFRAQYYWTHAGALAAAVTDADKRTVIIDEWTREVEWPNV